MASVSNAASGAVIWQANAVDEFGHVTSEGFGNGVVTTHIYDNVRGTLTGLQSTSGGATIQNWSYGHDAIGNMTFRKNTVAGYAENFAYDKFNRLTIVRSGTVQCYHGRFNSNMCYSGALQSNYAYDAIGNITYKSDVGQYSYDPNHPHAVATAGGNTYAYDANGNMTSGAGRTIQWTSFNKPSGIWTATAYTGFSYDANHNRVLKTTPVSETHYIGKLFERMVINGVAKDVAYIYAGSKLVAQREDVGGIVSTKYIHADHLGSVNVITDDAGNVLERLRFDVFGKPVALKKGTGKLKFGNPGGTVVNFGTNNTTRG